MTIDNEILFGKKEKEFNNNVNSIINGLREAAEINEVLEENAIPMVKVLKLKHSEPAEMLREANYDKYLNDILNKELNENDIYFLSKILNKAIVVESKSNKYSILKELREHIESNIQKTNSTDFESVLEGYSKIAEVYVLFESTREKFKIKYY